MPKGVDQGPEPDVVSVYTTMPDMASAKALAQGLLKDGFIACANAFPMTSWYRWEGRDEESAEVAMFLKTRRDLAGTVIAAIAARHPYDVPCAVVLDIVAGHAPYLDWVRNETRPPG